MYYDDDVFFITLGKVLLSLDYKHSYFGGQISFWKILFSYLVFSELEK